MHPRAFHVLGSLSININRSCSTITKAQYLGQWPITQGLNVSEFSTTVEVCAGTPREFTAYTMTTTYDYSTTTTRNNKWKTKKKEQKGEGEEEEEQQQPTTNNQQPTTNNQQQQQNSDHNKTVIRFKPEVVSEQKTTCFSKVFLSHCSQLQTRTSVTSGQWIHFQFVFFHFDIF